MQELKELSYILTKHKVRSIEIIGDDSRKQNSKLYQLYSVIRNGEAKNDAEASQLLYGEAQPSAKYRNLKHNLKNRLLNTIFFIDTNNSNSREKAYYSSWKQWSACIILKEKSAYIIATEIAEKVLKQALEHEFCDLIVASSLYLRRYYARQHKDVKRFNYYNQLYHEYREIEEYQNLAQEYYLKLIMNYAVESVTVNPQIKEDAEKYYEELAPFIEKTSIVKFHYLCYQIQLLGTMGVFDYQKSKEVCERAIQFLSSIKNISAGGVRNFLLNKLVCHIQLKEFEEGKATAIECEKTLQEGAFNWFKAKEFFFMLSIHTENYQDAYVNYKTITSHSRFNVYKDIFQETWLLYRMYLHFLFLMEKVTPYDGDNDFNNIRLGKFLNQVPSFSKDKHGMNIPVLIIQMAFLILQKKFDDALDRIEALEKYCSRYLKKDNPNFRCNCFIRMLLQIPISGFHKAGVERRALKYLNKMTTVEINFSNQAHEVEVLPFEIMWQFILDSLSNKFHKIKRKTANKK